MRIMIIEPYFIGSHAAWAREYAAFSSHEVGLATLEGRHWKWRMHGGAVTLAREYLVSGGDSDLILASDMLDLTTFLALTRAESARVPAAVYFHENQLTYPWSSRDTDTAEGRDAHYAFINYSSALAADAVFFNSAYHLESFLGGLPRFLRAFPDHNEPDSVRVIREKSSVLPLGLDLTRFDGHRTAASGSDPPLLLWNHRWEYDKNPDDFFRALILLHDEGLEFEVAVLGERFADSPRIFDEAASRLGRRIIRFGFESEFDRYAAWLWKSDILPVTSDHDFFGASVVQAIHCNCCPVLPRRLAYQEHIPAEMHDEFFYEDFEGFVRLLRGRIRDIDGTRGLEASRFVRDYDWKEMAPRYDGVLAGLSGSAAD